MNKKTTNIFQVAVGLAFLSLFGQKAGSQCPSTPNLQFVAEKASVPAENMLTIRKDALDRPFLYAASKEGGLKVYSITNAATPVQVAQLPVSNWDNLHLMSLEQKGDLLYLALGNHFNQPHQPPGLAIVSVADPAMPQVLDTWKGNFPEGGGGALVVGSGLVFLGAMFNGLLTLDVSDPSQIKPVSSYLPDMSFPHGVPPFHADTVKFNVRAFALRDSLLFTCYDRGGLRVLDVGDPASPVEVGRYCNENMVDFATAYNDVLLDGNLAYVSVDYLGVEILDISDLKNIVRVGWWNPWNGIPTNNPFVWAANDGHANEMFFNETCKMLFVVTGKSDLYALSVAIPALPQTCENYGGTGNGIGTYGLGGDDEHLYLAYIYTVIPFVSNWTGLKIISYDDCSVPVGTLPLPAGNVAIYPNPSDNVLNLSFENPPTAPFLLRLFDLAGREVFFKIVEPWQTGSGYREATNLPTGSYLVVIQEKGREPKALRWAVVR